MTGQGHTLLPILQIKSPVHWSLLHIQSKVKQRVHTANIISYFGEIYYFWRDFTFILDDLGKYAYLHFQMEKVKLKRLSNGWAWQCRPLTPALGRQRCRQMCVSSRPVWSTYWVSGQGYTVRPYCKKRGTLTKVWLKMNTRVGTTLGCTALPPGHF